MSHIGEFQTLFRESVKFSNFEKKNNPPIQHKNQLYAEIFSRLPNRLKEQNFPNSRISHLTFLFGVVFVCFRIRGTVLELIPNGSFQNLKSGDIQIMQRFSRFESQNY